MKTNHDGTITLNAYDTWTFCVACGQRVTGDSIHTCSPQLKQLTDEEIIACFDESEPVAWVYPEGLEALKAGKPWTAYGTRQEPNNTALYLSPQPDIAPYAWVTFTPYGDEDDVWYENPEGQLLEGWTYKPLYDTTPPQRKPLTDEEIEECFAESCTDFKLLENGKTKGVVNIIDVGRAILRKAQEKNESK
jgi:hypothetical protein